jgi:hypothetical protein
VVAGGLAYAGTRNEFGAVGLAAPAFKHAHLCIGWTAIGAAAVLVAQWPHGELDYSDCKSVLAARQVQQATVSPVRHYIYEGAVTSKHALPLSLRTPVLCGDVQGQPGYSFLPAQACATEWGSHACSRRTRLPFDALFVANRAGNVAKQTRDQVDRIVDRDHSRQDTGGVDNGRAADARDAHGLY